MEHAILMDQSGRVPSTAKASWRGHVTNQYTSREELVLVRRVSDHRGVCFEEEWRMPIAEAAALILPDLAESWHDKGGFVYPPEA